MPKCVENKNAWLTLSKEYLVTTKWLKLRKDQVRTHNGKEITYTFLDHPGSVLVVPMTAEREIVFLRQYRYTVNDWCWEVPAGSIESADLRTESLRELQEEVGLYAMISFL
ncbi:NUDIX domain-containing protein [Dictyobacter kobayashii]|uniref:Uncharacterized protein n=1 Tax=Dictyobacter kobayashii TaxID=2014872 RepID=A0A402ACA1_9CHLR|nr:NUDIX hydrolase [Dictyobacter kobayashii]GCE16711.1 hypothetical protein KDK_05110 [Dictyobacter kobayashii]